MKKKMRVLLRLLPERRSQSLRKEKGYPAKEEKRICRKPEHHLVKDETGSASNRDQPMRRKPDLRIASQLREQQQPGEYGHGCG